MPTYAYACKSCDHRFEAQQSFSDDALTECPECGGPLRKVFNSVGIVFKGSGFYRTDSRGGSTSTDTSSSSSSTSGSEKSTTSSTSSEKSPSSSSEKSSSSSTSGGSGSSTGSSGSSGSSGSAA